MGGQLIDHSPHSKVAHKQSLEGGKQMKIIINRLRWLSLGVTLGAFIMCYLETFNDDKKIDLTEKWSDYKHNHNKEAY